MQSVLICYHKHLLVGNVQVKESCLYICVHFISIGNRQFTQENAQWIYIEAYKSHFDSFPFV